MDEGGDRMIDEWAPCLRIASAMRTRKVNLADPTLSARAQPRRVGEFAPSAHACQSRYAKFATENLLSAACRIEQAGKDGTCWTCHVFVTARKAKAPHLRAGPC